MTKLLFQLPKLSEELTEDSKINASFALLGVVAITAIISLVFLFQHVLVASAFGDASAFAVFETVENANTLCAHPAMIVPDASVVDYLEGQRDFKCRSTKQGVWCCFPPNAR